MWGSIRGKAHPLPRNAQSNGQHFSGAMEEMSRGFKMQTLTSCDATFMSTRTAAGQFKGQSKGAMEEVLQKVQHASTHILRPQNHEHAHSSRSIQGSVQGGNGTLHTCEQRTLFAVLE